MSWSNGDAQDFNTLMQWLTGTHSLGMPVPDEDRGRDAALHLMGKAYKQLGAGFSPDRLAAVWEHHRVIERPRPVGTDNPTYATNGDRVWVVLSEHGQPAFEIVRDPDAGTVTITPHGRPWEAHTMPTGLARQVFAAGLAAAGLAAADPPRDEEVW